MKIYRIILSALAIIMASSLSQATYAQAKHGKADTVQQGKKGKAIDFSIQIVDVDGLPIRNAAILTSEGVFKYEADKDGIIRVKSRPKQLLLLQAEGYEEIQFAITANSIPEQVTMHRKPDDVSVSSISSISGDALESFPELVFSNILQGRIPGLQVMMAAGGLGNNTPDIYIRGNHGYENNGAMVIVDGLERSISDIVPEEVAKVEVLKDASAKIIYGPRAANGVLYITTKRGKAGTRIIRTTVESGVNVASDTPEFLDSYNYATLYNEARTNDGLLPKYSAAQLEGYRNSTGPNDLLYPNVDWYDYFTRNVSTYNNYMFDMSGGTERIRYAVVLNYKRATGFEKVGKLPTLDRFNVRGNIDVKVTDYLSVFADVAARMEIRSWGPRNMTSVYASLAANRPNEYPLMVSAENLGLPENEDGVPFFGASIHDSGNLLADMEYGGFSSERAVNSMVNMGLNFDFDDYAKGLRAKAVLFYDNYSYFGQGQTNVYPTYAIRGTNYEDLQFVEMRKQSLQSNQSRTSDNLNQTLGFNAEIDYARTLGTKNDLSARLGYNFYNYEVNGSGQDIRNENLYLNASYSYARRYSIDGVLSMMGSNRYAKGNRHFLAYSVGASWIISNEPFMQSVNAVDFLKLKASWGVLGYDKNTNHLFYKTAWSNGGNMSLGEQNKGAVERTTSFVRLGKDLKWEYSSEFNVGIEAAFLQHRLTVEVDGFNEIRNNIITAQTANLAGVLGGFVTEVNAGTVQNYGVDGSIRWADSKRNFRYEVGVNATWTANKLISWNEVNYPDKETLTVGKPTDAMLGYSALGLYGKDISLAGAPVQTFGRYSEGYIAYEDANGDGYVDSRDKSAIGNKFPRTTLGIDLRLGYKGWELFACGTAQLGKWTYMNNSFWQFSGEDKYSIIAEERYHPVNNPDGTYPSLTTLDASNNFVASTFWIRNASFFRLKNAELSYTFSFPNAGLKKLRLFVRGTNLFVFSGIKYLDPETLNAGLVTYPLYKTITGGATITF